MYDISVVIPTYGRDKELEALLESLRQQDYNRTKIQVIIVDQNDSLDLAPIINTFKNDLSLIHEKVTVKGIAYSKNVGIRLSEAGVITFADDDCLYYPDTISAAVKTMSEHPDVDIVYGRVYDRTTQKDVMRNWKKVPTKLNRWNYHLNYSAITCFTRLKDLYFNEGFGVGSKYGTGEELDYVMQALKQGRNIYFLPNIDIWHPEPGVRAMSAEKTYYYALGQGAIYRKNLSVPFLLFFMASCGFQCASVVVERLKGNGPVAHNRWLSFKGRVNGFFTYK